MNSLIAPKSRLLAISRLLIGIWIVITILITLASLPAKYQSFSSLKPGNVLGDPFYGWSQEQIQTAIEIVKINPTYIAKVRLVTSLICVFCFWAVAGLIFWRRSDTWTGLLAAYILFSVAGGFAGLQLVQSQLAPAVRSIYSLSGVLIWPTFFLVLYLFPNGKFVPRFTRYLAFVTYILFIASDLFNNNALANGIFTPLLLIYVIGGFISQIFRYWKVSTIEERQQTLWVVFAFGIFFFSIILFNYVVDILPGMKIGTQARFWFDIGNGTLGILFAIVLPFSIGISILRYRLWDIDIIIRKTLVYGLLTACLALIFFGVITLLQSLFSAISNQQSEISIVISTLAIAASFNPLRNWIQNSIDKRFYRRKYDAEKMLDRFSNSARTETDIERLSAELLDVVQETLQPQTAKIWLSPSKKRGGYDG